MPEGTLEKLGQALDKIDRPGSFCASGSEPAILPGLEVDGIGPIGLPLTTKQAKELARLGTQAPYGKGEKTLVDRSVRRVRRLEPGRFALTNPGWKPFLERVVGRVQAELGLEAQKLEAHRHDLLLYEPGGFFLPHRDGEKLDRMVATLVVFLPSTYEGGELVVRHDGQERTIDFRGAAGNPFDVHYAAFYADCEHEVRPVREGYRLALVYNLTLAKSRKAIAAPRISEHIGRVGPLVRAWAEGDDAAEKLVVTLDHQYTKDGIARDALKGADRAKAQVLIEAAKLAGCRAYLGLLTFWESGAAEETGGYRRRRRYHDEYDDEDGPYEMGEIYDTSLSAEHLVDGEGQGLPIGRVAIDKDELLDPEALTAVAPEQHVHGYTGNEGLTFDRWYRHAAILLWPERRHFQILCDRDSRAVVPALIQMVARWQKTRGKEAAALEAQCLALAAAILANWGEHRYAPINPEGPGNADLLESLAALGDPGLIGRYLGDVMVKDVGVDPGKALAEACKEYGWGTFREELRAAMVGTTSETIGRNVRLLEALCSAKPRKEEGWAGTCEALAQALVPAIEALDRGPSAPDWRSRGVDRGEVLAGLARSLILTGQFELLARVVDHALAAAKIYPLTTAHVPALVALRPRLKADLKGPCPALARWVAACREQLEALTAREPREPADARRKAPITCTCADCAELKPFLEDPRETVHRFRVREDRRRHLEHQIRDRKLDLESRTDRTGSPHTLVCTKTAASYRAALKTYHEDRGHLAGVRAIEASLPR